MTGDDHKPLLRQMARAFNTRNQKAFEALFSPAFVLHDPHHPSWPTGLEGVRHMWTTLLDIAPDLQLTIEDLVSEGEKVVVRWTFRGTVAREVHGQAAGEPFTAVSIAIYRITQGKIEEDWGSVQSLAQTDSPWN